MISTLGKNPDREKVIDFTSAYSPFFQAVFGPKTLAVKSPADLAGKTVGVTRGAMEDQELGKIMPPATDVKRFEDNNAHHRRLRLGPGAADGRRRLGGRQHDGEEPAARHRIQAAAEGLAELHRRGQGRGQAAPKVNEIIAAAKKSGDLEQDVRMKWLGRPVGDLP